MSSLNPQQDYENAMALKDEGNEAFSKKDYKKALKCYSRMFMYLGMNPSVNMGQLTGQSGMKQPTDLKRQQETKVNMLRITAFNNLAAVYFAQGQWEECREKCTNVLDRDKQNIKALFRRARAYRHLGNVDLAREDLQALKELDHPKVDRKAIERELKLLKKEEKKHEKAFMKTMARGMRRKKRKDGGTEIPAPQPPAAPSGSGGGGKKSKKSKKKKKQQLQQQQQEQTSETPISVTPSSPPTKKTNGTITSTATASTTATTKDPTTTAPSTVTPSGYEPKETKNGETVQTITAKTSLTMTAGASSGSSERKGSQTNGDDGQKIFKDAPPVTICDGNEEECLQF